MSAVHAHILRWLGSLLLAMVLVAPTLAQQQPITFQYFYDEIGQLVKVVDSTGVVIEYVYDAVGNMLEVKRSSASGLAIFNFTPQQGPVTTQVTIQGQGFSATPTANIVRFNGTPAHVLSATATVLTVIVPTGATTGPITVEVGGTTATSSRNFTVTTAPVITMVSPLAALAGVTIPTFQVSGFNLTGSTFSFLPTFVPPNGIAITSTAIDPSGTSAILSLTVGTGARGTFVLVATNAEGQSDTSPTSGNTLNIVDPQNADADTDGDGFQNGLEILFGANPFDPQSVPQPEKLLAEAVGATFSLVNSDNPTGTGLPTEVVGAVFSVLNTENPTGSALPNETVGPTFSIRNQ